MTLLEILLVCSVLGNAFLGFRLIVERGRASLAVDRADDSARFAEVEHERANRRDRNAWEFFGMIDSVLRERDTWKRAYYASCSGAAAAQTWLFRELNRVTQIANGYASKHSEKPVKIDPQLSALMETPEHHPTPEPAPGKQDSLEVRRRQLDEQEKAEGTPA